MPDPNEFPVNGGELPQENAPQQPQYGYQQPQQQYNYQQPQYNYQQPQQQYNYQQPQQAQQPQHGYQQPRQAQQPQYGYQQPQQAQQPYGYQQPQYGYQPVPQSPYGVQRQAAAPVTHKKAIGSMIMMFIALSFLAYPLFYSLVSGFRTLSYGAENWLSLIGTLCLIAGLILMLVGAIIGSRGHKLFGIGLLVCLAYELIDHIYYVISMWDYYEEGINVLLLLFGVMLIIGTLLAAIGCLARVKALKIVGGILMLVNLPIVWILDFGTLIDWYGESNSLVLFYILRLIGFIFACIAVLAFPIRKPKN